MKINGVPREGKWLAMDGGLHIQIPYGAAYGKDEDGNWDIIELENCSSYKSGPFTVDDEAPFRWKLSGLHPQSVSIGDDVPQAVRSQLPRLLQLIAIQMTGGKPSDQPYELGSSTQVEETEEGFTLRSSISASEAGGAYKIFELSPEKAFAVIQKNIQIMGITLGFRYVLLALASPSGAKFFMGSLAVPDADGDLEKMAQAVRPLLESARLEDGDGAAAETAAHTDGSGNADSSGRNREGKKKASAGAKKSSSSGSKVPSGGPRRQVTGLPKGGGRVQLLDGLSVQLPAGAVYYYDEDQNACFGVPEKPPKGYREGTFSMPEDTPMLWQVTKLHHEGTVSYEPEHMDAGEANKLCFESFRENMGNVANGIADTMTKQLIGLGGKYAGKLDMAREDRMLSYVWAKNELLEERYFPGYFFVGLPSSFEMPIFMGCYDPIDIPVFEQQLLPVLRSAQRTGDAAQSPAVHGESGSQEALTHDSLDQFGSYAAEDGRLNAVTVAQLFSTDVLFFNEDDFRKNGLESGVRINALKLSEHPFLVKKRDVFLPEIIRLLLELDQVPELRVPKEKIHKKLLPLLFNDNDVPLTGMTMMNLLAYHMLHIQENGQDDYSVVIDRNLVAGIPDAYRYVGALLRQLRQYNGKNEAFTMTFANAMNFDTPIQGALKPVTGAAQPRSMYRIRVERDGTVQELEAEENAGQPEQGERRSIQELESALPPEFAAQMRRFAGDVAARLGQLRETLQQSSYNDLTSTEEVLDRLMDQAGDYGLAWGIYNFYNIFRLGASDSSFSYEKDGQRDISGSGFECPGYRVDEQYEDYAPGDPDFQADEFPRQLAERIGGITQEEIYRTILEQAVGYQEQGYSIVDQERIRIEKQQKALEKVPFDRVPAVTIPGSAFVLTGEFAHCGNDREAIKAKILEKGGRCTQAVSGKTSYLVIGSFGDYGARKLEQVQAQRAKGSAIKIIREEDLFAALEGRPIPQGTPKKTVPAAQKESAARKEPDVRVRSVPPRPGEMARVEVTAQLSKISMEPEEMTREEAAAQLLNVLRMALEKAERQQADYDSACQAMEKAKTAAALRKAAKAFEALEGYQDSNARKTQCSERAQVLEEEQKKKKAEEKARREAEQAAAKQQADYDSACQAMEKAKSVTALRKAAKAFGALGEYRDSAERRTQCLEQAKRLEEERNQRKEEEKARREKEQAEQAAAAQAQREKAQAQKAKRRKKLLLAVALVAAAIGIFFGVRRYMDGAPYRELAKSIDEGTFHYSQYEDSYFLQYDGSYQVIADKLTDFHHADDIQSAVNLIGSLPPDESSIDYYINGWEIYMTDSFRLWFLEQVSAEGTALSFPEGMEYQGDEVTGVYQLGDYWVMTVYNYFLADDGRPEQAYICEAEEGEGWVYLGSYQNRNNRAGQQYGIE